MPHGRFERTGRFDREVGREQHQRGDNGQRRRGDQRGAGNVVGDLFVSLPRAAATANAAEWQRVDFERVVERGGGDFANFREPLGGQAAGAGVELFGDEDEVSASRT